MYKKIDIRARIFIPIIAYRLFLDCVYFLVITPRFSYSGLVDNRTIINGIISWLVLLLFYFLIKQIIICDSNKNSDIIITILFLVSFVPFTTCIYAGIVHLGFITYNSLYWFILILCIRVLEKVQLKPLPKIKDEIIGKRLIILIVVASILLVLYISFKYTHFRLIFNLFNVYDVRLEAREYNFNNIISYGFSWVLAINPVLLGLFVIRKKWIMAILSFFFQMVCFGVDGLKSTFFMPFLVIVFIILYRKEDTKQLKRLIVWGLLGFVILAFIEYTVIHTTYITDYVVRRMFIIPNQLGEYYFDFFTKNPPDFFRSSFLRHFGFQSPYTEGGLNGYSFVIGAQYFGKPSMNCNNGLSSDAIANFGILGCIIMPVFLAYFLRLFDRSTINVNKKVSITPAVFISYNLLSTNLTVVLLTHGLLLLILFMSLMGNYKGYRKKF